MHLFVPSRPVANRTFVEMSCLGPGRISGWQPGEHRPAAFHWPRSAVSVRQT